MVTTHLDGNASDSAARTQSAGLQVVPALPSAPRTNHKEAIMAKQNQTQNSKPRKAASKTEKIIRLLKRS